MPITPQTRNQHPSHAFQGHVAVLYNQGPSISSWLEDVAKVVLAIAAFAGVSSGQSQPDVYSKYKSAKYAIEFVYPKAWQITEAPDSLPLGCDNSEDESKKLCFSDPSALAELGCASVPTLKVSIANQSDYHRPMVEDYGTLEPLAGTKAHVLVGGLSATLIQYATGAPEGGRDAIEQLEIARGGKMILFEFRYSLAGFQCVEPGESSQQDDQDETEARKLIDRIIKSISFI